MGYLVPMTKKRKIVASVFTLALLVTIGFYSLSDIGHQAIRLHLQLYGASLYEYHGQTGRWPTQIDDLAQTSLPQKSPHWKIMLEDGANVIVWPKNLKADPKDNAAIILAYHNKGLLASLGRVWVCWGDLRTEYITTEELQAHLAAAQE